MWSLRIFVLLIALFGCGMGYIYPSPGVCLSKPKFWGNCKMHARGFTFIAFISECVPIVGSCEGTENFFRDKISCESMCKSRPSLLLPELVPGK